MTVIVSDASVWSFATVPDAEVCPSVLVGHALAAPGASLVCGLDHAETGEVLHASGPVRWSDADAAAARAAVGWRCLYCSAPCGPGQYRGCCTSRCARLEHDAGDEFDIEEAEA